METEVILGWIASSLCTLILVPQIIKALQTRHTDDISLNMLVLSVTGNAFWAAHAILTENIPLFVGASLISMMSILLIIFKFKFDTKY